MAVAMVVSEKMSPHERYMRPREPAEAQSMFRNQVPGPEVRERAVQMVLEHRGAPVGVGGDLFDCREVRPFVWDAAAVGATS